MKRILTKTLTAASFAMLTFSAAYAVNDSSFPSAARELGEPLPATLKYFEQRANPAAANVGAWSSPFPSAAIEYPEMLPATLQYLAQRASGGGISVGTWVSPFPSAARELGEALPATLKYFEQRDAALAKQPTMPQPMAGSLPTVR